MLIPLEGGSQTTATSSDSKPERLGVQTLLTFIDDFGTLKG